MALTRSLLRGMGLTDEQVSSIIEAHTDTVDGLKAERDKYKAEAEKLPEVQKQLDALKGGEDWKAKYEAESKAFSDYKKDQADRETLGKVKDAYRQLLRSSNVGEKHIDSILRVTDFSKMKLDGDGLADAEKLTEGIKSDWGGFIASTETKGATVETPPANVGANKRSKEDILAIKDAGERQKAIAENHELFGF